MTTTAYLWAIGYDDTARADEVRDELIQLAWGPGQAARYLLLLDIAVVVRHPNGTFTLDRQPFLGLGNIAAWTTVGFLAGLVLAAPLAGATVGALLWSAGTAAATRTGISEAFIREVREMMKPATSAHFILADVETKFDQPSLNKEHAMKPRAIIAGATSVRGLHQSTHRGKT